MVNMRSQKKQNIPFFGIIYGRPGVGKTSLLAKSNSFFIGNEINKEFDFKGFEPYKNYKQFLEQLEALRDMDIKEDTIVIDNMTDTESFMINDFVGESTNLSTGGGGYGAGYNECEKRINKILKSYVKYLQYEKGKNVVFICHASEVTEMDNLTGIERRYYKPSLEKKTIKCLENHADFVFHLHRPVLSKKNGSSPSPRVLYTTFSSGCYAKKKSYIDLPDELIVDKDGKTWERINDALKIDSGEKANEDDKEIKKLYKIVKDKGIKLPPFKEMMKRDRSYVMNRLKELNQ